jgi:hypothetical protein
VLTGHVYADRVERHGEQARHVLVTVPAIP